MTAGPASGLACSPMHAACIPGVTNLPGCSTQAARIDHIGDNDETVQACTLQFMGKHILFWPRMQYNDKTKITL